MIGRRRFLALAFILLTVPTAGSAQNSFPAVNPDLRASDDGWGPTRIAAKLGTPVSATDSAPDRAGRASGAAGDGSAATGCQFEPRSGDGVFACGTSSVQFLAGAYFSGRPGPRVPAFNYVPVSVRLGWMLTDPADGWWGRGNWECICDNTAAAIISDYGHWFAGQSYLLRYNYLAPVCPVVPYHQLGAGWVINDAYKDQNQHAIGQALEFYLHYEIGLKYFVAPNMSLDIECGIQHISNGGLANRNLGVNAFGAQIGVTYYLPAGRP